MRVDKVAVLGAASTAYGIWPGRSARDLAIEAVDGALRDAGVGPRDIETAYFGYAITGLIDGQESGVGQLALKDLGITRIPITRVENACSSASSAFREAWLAIQAGACDVAVAFGAEKMTGGSTLDALDALAGASDLEWEGGQGLTFPGVFAMIAQRHMLEYGTTREQIAQVAVKNHANAALNPKAQYRNPITVEEVLASRPVADPLRLLDCCPISDGAAAVVLASRRAAARFGLDHVWLVASEQSSGSYASEGPITRFDATEHAAAKAFEAAGVAPLDLDLVEVHDCFTIAEIIHTEDLGLCPKGEGGKFVEAGQTLLTGPVPVNVSGGLKARGHPVGATGLGQVVEIVDQLKGRAGARQLPAPKVGLAHCMGAFFHGDCGTVTIQILER